MVKTSTESILVYVFFYHLVYEEKQIYFFQDGVQIIDLTLTHKLTLLNRFNRGRQSASWNWCQAELDPFTHLAYPIAGLAGAHGGADLRPAPRSPRRNLRPTPRAPVRPRAPPIAPGLTRVTTPESPSIAISHRRMPGIFKD